MSSTKGPVRVTRDGQPVSEVLPNADAAFGWILGHQPMSVDWATRYEGYAVEPLDVQPWPEGPEHGHAANLHALAAGAFRHQHSMAFADAEEEALVRENCGACALFGYGELSGDDAPDGPRQPNRDFARVYVEAGRSIPRRWYPAFLAALNDEGNPAYRLALHRSVATFGVRFVD